MKRQLKEANMAIAKSTPTEIEAGLKGLSGWELKNDKLHRELKFKNFVQAFGFMTQVAILAQEMDHHPEWSNVYSRVTIDLATHEAGGISARDFELAQKIDKIVASINI
jgi:4a-hydroxytetrahydrobiopterin dehydratase